MCVGVFVLSSGCVLGHFEELHGVLSVFWDKIECFY